MQPFTVESIEETLILFGVDIAGARAAVERVFNVDDVVVLLTDAIGESVHGAVIDSGATLREGIDALAGPCRRGGVSLSCADDLSGVVEVDYGGQTKSFDADYRPQESSFASVVHAVEKAAAGHVRIFPLRSTFGCDATVYAVLTKADWERLLRILGAPAFDLLFVGLEGQLIV